MPAWGGYLSPSTPCTCTQTQTCREAFLQVASLWVSVEVPASPLAATAPRWHRRRCQECCGGTLLHGSEAKQGSSPEQNPMCLALIGCVHPIV